MSKTWNKSIMLNAPPLKDFFWLRNVRFDHQHRQIVSSEKKTYLTKKESDVLFLLCMRAPDTVTHDELREYAWKGTYASSLSIAQIIRKLRVKLDDNNKSIIISHPKLGYRLSGVKTDDVTVLCVTKKRSLWRKMLELIPFNFNLKENKY